MKLRRLMLECGVFALVSLSGSAVFAQQLSDYRESRVQQDAPPIQRIAGIYDGSLVSVSSGAVLSSIEIQIAPSIRTISSNDGTSVSVMPALIGTVSFINKSSTLKLDFSNVDYDAASGEFRASIIDSISQTYMTMVGVLNGSNLKGTITAENYASNGGAFNVSLGASLPVPPASSAPNAISYVGSMLLEQSSTGVQMNISFDNSHSNPLVPIEKVNVSLVMNSSIMISFQDAQIDLSNGNLMAQGSSEGEINSTLALNCYGSPAKESSAKNAYSCTFMNLSNGTQHSFMLKQQ